MTTTTHPAGATARARRSYHDNLRALRASQKPARGTAAYSRYVNRPAGRRVAAAAHLVGMTPNTATAISASLSATALVLFAVIPPSTVLGLTVSLLLAGGYVMDSVDGQLARLRGGGSAAGEWLDHTVDCVKTCAFHLSVLVAMYRFWPGDSDAILLVPIAFLLVDVACFFGMVTMPLLRTLHRSAASPAPSTSRREHPLRTWLILPTDYGLFCWVFVLAGLPAAFAGAYALLFAINAAVLVLALAKWWRELNAIDHLDTTSTGRN